MKIIQSILGVLGVIIIFFIVDLFCISDRDKPLIYFKESYNEDGFYVYNGILYDVHHCVGSNVISGTHLVFKWDEFECERINQVDIKKIKVTNIVDMTKSDSNYICDEKKEILFEDSVNRYYFNCTKSVYIFVSYDDGTSENLKTAISKGHVSMSDLDNFEINYIKESK